LPSGGRADLSRSDPAAQWTGAHKGHAFFAHADNYLIDLKAAIIVDVEATRAIRQAEVGAARTRIERTEERLELCPERIAADSAYGSAEMLGWLVDKRAIEPHIPVFDKSGRADGTFSRDDFAYDQQSDVYICPAGKVLTSTGTLVNDGTTLLYRANKYDCDACELKPRCCPKMPSRKVPRSIHERARDVAREIAKTDAYVRSRRERKKIEMLFAHLKRILRLDRLRLRGAKRTSTNLQSAMRYGGRCPTDGPVTQLAVRPFISVVPSGSLRVQPEKHCCGGWQSIGGRWRSHLGSGSQG
jgi:hypothetical protein